MTVAYDRAAYEPPAPVFDVFLSAPGDPGARIATTALLDTGADMSALAIGIGERLGLPLVGHTLLAGIDEDPERCLTWLVHVETPAGGFDVRAAEIGGTTILGRDVLNQLSLRYDGPKLQLTF